jgi:hypothetical protein
LRGDTQGDIVNALLTGIYTKFNAANTFKTAVGGRMFSRYAPQDTPYPFAVLDIVTGIGDWNFTQAFDDVDIQFNLFSQSTSETEIGDLYAKLRVLYDDCALTVVGYTHLLMHYDQYWSFSDPKENIRQYTVQYNILLKS